MHVAYSIYSLYRGLVGIDGFVSTSSASVLRSNNTVQGKAHLRRLMPYSAY